MIAHRLARALATLVLALAPALAHAQEPDSALMMQKWQEYMTPGPPHQQLAKVAGEWEWTSSWWMSPDAPPQTSSGTMTARPIMGGRYVVEDMKGTAMGMPFEGHALNGYDNAKDRYFSVWVDNFGTGVMTMWGTYDEATKTMTMEGSYIDPVTGKEKATRSVTKHVDDNHFVFEMFGPGPDGKEQRTMELHAKRKS